MSKEQPTDDLMRLADDYAEACFEQALHRRSVDEYPEITREKLEKSLLRLHAENEALKRELIKEAARTAEEKRRADQVSLQHSSQAALNREAREQLARYAAEAITDKAKHGGVA